MPLAPSLPRTAFIVDDDEAIARSLARVVTDLGYEVLGTATSTEEALERIPALAPSFVIIDIDLAKESGVRLAAGVLQTADLPIVFLTGLTDPDMTPLMGSDGVFGFLQKPANRTSLRATIELVRMQAAARTRLQRLERHYHALFEQAAVGVAEIDGHTGRLLDVNQKCAKIFASSVPTMIGRELAALIASPDERARFCEAIARTGSGEHVAELWCHRDDERTVCVRITAAPLDATVDALRYVIIIEDITDRRTIEVQLERQRRLLAESQRNAEIGSLHVDCVTGEVEWSDEAYRLHGVSEDFVPTRTSLLALVHPDDRGLVSRALYSPIGAAPNLMYRVRLQDGTDRMLHCAGAHVPRLDGGMALVGTVQNVTERERGMSERIEIEARARAAIEASRAKTEFLAHMSHELRTPLNAVLGLSEALIERVFGDLNDAQANTLATIHKSGHHLLDLINDVLDIARVESGKLPLEVDQVLMRPLIDETTALVYAQLTVKGQRLVIDLAPALPPIDVDRRRIKQVLLNLLGNASKFSPPGATVTLRAAVTELRREVEISVCDTGPGIDPADRDRVFEAFVTLDPSMSRVHGGVGLGLTLAKRIVDLHGGRIRVDSSPGGGATFVITLPVSTNYFGDPPGSARVAQGELAFAKHRATVLLAEDNQPTVMAVASYLQSRGYQVRVAKDGPSALEGACEPDIDAVLMDIHLPGMNGLEVTRRMRLRTESANKPVIALTAYAMPGDEERCLEAGATAYLTKPVMLRKLAAVLDMLLGAPA